MKPERQVMSGAKSSVSGNRYGGQVWVCLFVDGGFYVVYVEFLCNCSSVMGGGVAVFWGGESDEVVG